MDRNLEGCETIKELWKVAQECNVNRPGIDGTPSRVMGFVQCKNVHKFMAMATMKCWEERSNGFPPSIQFEEKVEKSYDRYYDNGFDQKGSKNK